jgi:hypothetical protein
VSSGDETDTGPVLALEPLSTILLGNYRHLQHPQALDRLTLFLGDRSQEHTVPRRLCLGDSAQETLPRSTSFLEDSAQEHTVPRSNLLLGDSSEERARVL